MLAYRLCGFMPAPSATFRSSSLAAARINTVNSFLQLMAPTTIPMTCSIGLMLPNRWGTLPKPKGSIAFL